MCGKRFVHQSSWHAWVAASYPVIMRDKKQNTIKFLMVSGERRVHVSVCRFNSGLLLLLLLLLCWTAHSTAHLVHTWAGLCTLHYECSGVWSMCQVSVLPACSSCSVASTPRTKHVEAESQDTRGVLRSGCASICSCSRKIVTLRESVLHTHPQ